MLAAAPWAAHPAAVDDVEEWTVMAIEMLAVITSSPTERDAGLQDTRRQV